jgi:hypothetical protein
MQNARCWQAPGVQIMQSGLRSGRHPDLTIARGLPRPDHHGLRREIIPEQVLQFCAGKGARRTDPLLFHGRLTDRFDKHLEHVTAPRPVIVA